MRSVFQIASFNKIEKAADYFNVKTRNGMDPPPPPPPPQTPCKKAGCAPGRSLFELLIKFYINIQLFLFFSFPPLPRERKWRTTLNLNAFLKLSCSKETFMSTLVELETIRWCSEWYQTLLLHTESGSQNFTSGKLYRWFKHMDIKCQRFIPLAASF